MIPLRIVEPPFPENREPGMMWRWPPGDVKGRECWWIMLPRHPLLGTRGHPGELSWRTTDRASDPPHQMWDVSGVPPLITVSPSIDVECWIRQPDDTSIREGSYWHGWIRDGQLDPG